MKRKVILLIWMSITLLVACFPKENIHHVSADNTSIDIENEEKVIQKHKDPVEIKITAVGDIMVHGPQLRAQYDKKNKTYNFKNNFAFIKPYITKSDIALCNLETTFAGANKGYSSFPKFNSPDVLGEAIKDAGFDVVITANNHTLDSGGVGVLRTVKILKDFSLNVVGTKEHEKDDNFIIKEIKGAKFGIIAYTYETPKFGENKTLNTLIIPKELENCINTFNYDELDKDLEKMKKEIQKMKEKGAEAIIFYLHWGNEYHQKPNEYQKKIAAFLASEGVDIIFASHPHVLQPIEFIEGDEVDKKTLVVYSMGNFLSNQRYEILKNRSTEDGIIVNVTFVKDFENNKIYIKEVTYLPTWVHKYFENGKRTYEIIPLPDALNNNKIYHLSNEKSLWRAKNSMNNTVKLIDSNSNEKIIITPPL